MGSRFILIDGQKSIGKQLTTQSLRCSGIIQEVQTSVWSFCAAGIIGLKQCAIKAVGLLKQHPLPGIFDDLLSAH